MINWAMGEFYMIASYVQYLLVAYVLGPETLVARRAASTAGCSSRFLLEPC